MVRRSSSVLSTSAAVVLAATPMALAPWALAQPAAEPPYPSRVVRIIEPFAPGGSTDQVSRMLSERLAQRLGQPVIVEHRPGAGGVVGMEAALRAPADGHTLVVAPVGPWAVNPHMHKLSYDPVNDVAMVIRLLSMQGLVLVHPKLPVRTIPELVALAGKRPGELNYGSSGIGGWGHVSAELFCMLAGVRMTHVPYKGSAPALADLVGGHLQVLFNTVSTTLPHVSSGRVRAIAVTGASRLDALPTVPTVAEAGVPGYENTTWSALGAPGRTPRPVIDRLNREVASILQTTEVLELARQQSSTVLGGTPEEAQAHLKSEIAKYGRVIRDAGIRP